MKSTDLGREHKDRFFLSIEGEDDPEMNARMMALVATIVRIC